MFNIDASSKLKSIHLVSSNDVNEIDCAIFLTIILNTRRPLSSIGEKIYEGFSDECMLERYKRSLSSKQCINNAYTN